MRLPGLQDEDGARVETVVEVAHKDHLMVVIMKIIDQHCYILPECGSTVCDGAVWFVNLYDRISSVS